MKRNDKEIKSKDDTLIDLAAVETEAREAEIARGQYQPFACPQCNNHMVLDSTYRQKNPYGGTGYYCSNVHCKEFGEIVDISIVKLPYAIKTEPVDVGDPTLQPIEFIMEDKGLDLRRGGADEYVKYDPEPGDDERMKLQGWHVLRSQITLTDSQGNNKNIVIRTQD